MRVSFFIFAVLIFSAVLLGGNIMISELVDEYQPITGVGDPNTTFFNSYSSYQDRAQNVTNELWSDTESSVNNPNIADQFGFIASASRTIRGVKDSVSDSRTIISQAGAELHIHPAILEIAGFVVVLLFIFAVASAIFKWNL